MPVIFEMSLVKVGNSLRVTIPQEIVKALNLKVGDILAVQLTDNEIIMRKKMRS